MSRATLVVMAAGIGSRFGEGIKQLEPVGPNGELIVDYSIKDAISAGFDKVVFVIRKDLEKDFKEKIGNRVQKQIPVEYVFQQVEDIPKKYQYKFPHRKKPWGTGQAILCCKDVVQEPFLVINADDYYGKEAYIKAFKYLMNSDNFSKNRISVCMVGFVLKNTLSENGGVTRGICRVDGMGMLTEIVETHNIMKKGNKAIVRTENIEEEIDMEAEVSMTMWGFTPEIFGILEYGFRDFLKGLQEDDLKAEFLLPIIIGKLLIDDEVEVKVLQSNDEWFGVTYKEDKAMVVQAIKNLINSGKY